MWDSECGIRDVIGFSLSSTWQAFSGPCRAWLGLGVSFPVEHAWAAYVLLHPLLLLLPTKRSLGGTDPHTCGGVRASALFLSLPQRSAGPKEAPTPSDNGCLPRAEQSSCLCARGCTSGAGICGECGWGV